MKLPRILLNIETSSAYGRNLARGFGRYSRIHQPLVLIAPPRIYHGDDIAREFAQHIGRLQVDAVLTRDFEEPVLEALEKLDIPTIFVSHIHPELRPAIQVDDARVGQMAAEHFLERGLRRFGYCGLEPYYWSERRRLGFIENIAAAACAVDCFQRPRSAEDRSTDREIFFIADWLKKLPKPVGVLACTDDRAQMLVQAAELIGLRVPEEIAVLGVDNDEFICDISHIPLSSVMVDSVQSGFAAAELLMEMIDSGAKREDVIYSPATHVEPRQSSDILAIEDPELAKALAFINKRVNQKLSVDDVALHAGISKTVLNYRFQKHLSRSIFDHINRVRIRRMCWLLENTEMSILDIALAMGMDDDKHLYRYFKRYTGETPLKWRRKMRAMG
jgi:LacI family transcriptional regulator